MAVFRVNHPDPYTHIHNAMLRDGRLSAKTKGVLAMMLSCPPDWDFSVRGLSAMTGEGRHSVKGCMDELKAAGYLRVTKLPPGKGSSNRYEYVYDVYGLSQEAIVENEGGENPQVVQGAENRPLTGGGSDQLSAGPSSAGFEAFGEPCLNKVMNDKGKHEGDSQNQKECTSPPSVRPSVKGAPDGVDAMVDGLLRIAVNRNDSEWVTAKAKASLRRLLARGYTYPVIEAALAAYQEALRASGRLPEFYPNIAKMLDPANAGGVAFFLPEKMPSARLLGTYLKDQPGYISRKRALDVANDTGTREEREGAQREWDAFVKSHEKLAYERWMRDKAGCLSKRP
ncbi:hypothetical protein [Raoultibacter phocaeensis]|uniref:hypothetical protein n=1 Tax=Raoultibacter phocaeensis TaxID=2479841 RepID=UPI00111A1420|nr:hypothetical protein [Raoultibacter phocaeensis]